MIDVIIKCAIILVAVLAAIYSAYISGLLTFTSHVSLLYVGNIKRAKFSKCSGTFKKIIRFKEAKSYRFELKQELSQGNLKVEVIDKSKNLLLSLDGKTPVGNIYPQSKARYYLVVKAEKASGRYELDWI